MSSRPTRSLLATASALTVFALGLTACAGGDQPATGATPAGSPGPEKIKVVASTNVWGSVLHEVGGDKVQVTSIIHDPSADPHSYETTPADAVAANDAKLTLGNGGGYDDFFTKLSERASSARKLVAYDIAETGNENEHVWYDLPSVEKIAERVAAELGELQPASKQAFTDNASAFKAKAEDLLKKLRQIGTVHPGSKVIATEPVARYLLDAAKATDVTPTEFSKAVENETDIPVTVVEQVKQLISGKQVKAVVNNAQTVTPVTEQTVRGARAAGVAVVEVTETLPVGVTDYLRWMSTEVDALAGALNA